MITSRSRKKKTGWEGEIALPWGHAPFCINNTFKWRVGDEGSLTIWRSLSLEGDCKPECNCWLELCYRSVWFESQTPEHLWLLTLPAWELLLHRIKWNVISRNGGEGVLNVSLSHQSFEACCYRVGGCGILAPPGSPQMLLCPANHHSAFALKTIVARGP